jgi:hypothetical protein
MIDVNEISKIMFEEHEDVKETTLYNFFSPSKNS